MTSRDSRERDNRRCPICGRGTLRDVSFDEGERQRGRRAQDAGSRQVESYTCGHEVIGPTLASADADALDVERRVSEETVDPPTG
jgi:hypothetical protein